MCLEAQEATFHIHARVAVCQRAGSLYHGTQVGLEVGRKKGAGQHLRRMHRSSQVEEARA